MALDADASRPERPCFILDTAAPCRRGDACCLDAGARVRSVQLAGVPDACLARAARRAMRVTVAGAPRAARPLRGRAPDGAGAGGAAGEPALSLRLSGRLPGARTPVCLDLSQVPVSGCRTLAELCGGGGGGNESCAFVITSAPAMAFDDGVWRRVSCCVGGRAAAAAGRDVARRNETAPPPPPPPPPATPFTIDVRPTRAKAAQETGLECAALTGTRRERARAEPGHPTCLP
jgi:hypothetical protein